MRDLWSRFRDRLLVDQRFHRLALRLPLVRSVGRRRARAIFDLCAGFVYTQVLLACVRLNVLTALADGPLTSDRIAELCGLGPDEAERLLRAALPLGLIEERSSGRFGLGYLGAPLLANPGLIALIQHNQLFYADLADPVAMLQGTSGSTRLSDYWPYALSEDPTALSSANIEGYSELMAVSQAMIASDIIAAYDFSRHRKLLDVGGGDGAFCRAVAAACPALHVTTADLPAVAKLAESKFAVAGLAARASAWGGDFLHDPLPAGADIITLIRVVHDHCDEDVKRLLRSVRASVAPEGLLLIAEQLAGTPGAESVGDTYFGMYLFAMRRGRPRTSSDIVRLLRETGFEFSREIPMPLPLQGRLLLARPLVG